MVVKQTSTPKPKGSHGTIFADEGRRFETAHLGDQPWMQNRSTFGMRKYFFYSKSPMLLEYEPQHLPNINHPVM